MNPFKVRDKVICVKEDNRSYENLILGEIYTVVTCNSSHVLVNGKFKRKNGTIVQVSDAYHYSYFEKKLAGGLNIIEPNPKKSKECEHNWKTYIGFNNSFEYCEVCDVKR